MKKNQYDYWCAEDDSIFYFLRRRKIKADNVPIEYLIREAEEILDNSNNFELCFLHDNVRVYSVDDNRFVVRNPYTRNLGIHETVKGLAELDKVLRPLLRQELYYIKSVIV